MSKKQSLTRAIALGLLLSTPFCGVAFATPGTDVPDKNETVVIGSGGINEPDHKNANATDASGDTGDKGGDVGALTVTGTISADKTVTGNIELKGTGGNGGTGGENTNIGGVGGIGGAGGSSKVGIEIAKDIQMKDISITAQGGNGGNSGVGDDGNGANGGAGGSAHAYGVTTTSGLGDIVVNTIDSTAQGGTGGSGGAGGGSGIGYGVGGVGGVGAAAYAYGINSTGGAIDTAVDTINSTATGGNGGNGGAAYYTAGAGGNAGSAHAYGVHAAGFGNIAVDTINSIAIGGKGGNSDYGGRTGGNGGNGGNAYAYGVHATGGNTTLSVDTMVVEAIAGMGGAATSGGANGDNGAEATAYGVYAESGGVVNLSANTGNTITISVKASGAKTTNKAYAVYANGATVLFEGNAILNNNGTGIDTTVETYLNNATFGFGGEEVGRTITGGVLNLQGSNTLVVNTDLTNNVPTVDKITFDSLAAGSSTDKQYISMGYDPLIENAEQGKITLENSLEILNITELNGQVWIISKLKSLLWTES